MRTWFRGAEERRVGNLKQGWPFDSLVLSRRHGPLRLADLAGDGGRAAPLSGRTRTAPSWAAASWATSRARARADASRLLFQIASRTCSALIDSSERDQLVVTPSPSPGSHNNGLTGISCTRRSFCVTVGGSYTGRAYGSVASPGTGRSGRSRRGADGPAIAEPRGARMFRVPGRRSRGCGHLRQRIGFAVLDRVVGRDAWSSPLARGSGGRSMA